MEYDMNNAEKLLFQAHGLKKSFKKNKNEISVLNGVSLEVKKGDLTAIVGASGAGKSTLLHVLGTLEKPSAGKIYFFQNSKPIDLEKFSDSELSRFRNRQLGFVFQFHYLLPEFNALENVFMPLLIAGEGFKKAEKKAKDILKFVGLENRLDHRPAELSGGEQQRVAIARSVIMEPKVLFADEPTGNLDAKNKEVIMDLLLQLNKETGVSILMVTHDFDLANRMNQVLEMKDGKCV